MRDIATLISRGGSGATTVAATSHLAWLVGIRVFATGGLGGVHRQARDSWDESADLTTLSVTPMTVVCSGVKSILDVGATLERLETLNVGVLGYGTLQFPGFYLTDSGFATDWAADTPEDVAARDARASGAAGAVGPRRRAIRCPWPSSSTPTCTTASSRRACASPPPATSPARTSRRSCSTTSTAPRMARA